VSDGLAQLEDAMMEVGLDKSFIEMELEGLLKTLSQRLCLDMWEQEAGGSRVPPKGSFRRLAYERRQKLWDALAVLKPGWRQGMIDRDWDLSIENGFGYSAPERVMGVSREYLGTFPDRLSAMHQELTLRVLDANGMGRDRLLVLAEPRHTDFVDAMVHSIGVRAATTGPSYIETSGTQVSVWLDPSQTLTEEQRFDQRDAARERTFGSKRSKRGKRRSKR
jgi:hypothetical protein